MMERPEIEESVIFALAQGAPHPLVNRWLGQVLGTGAQKFDEWLDAIGVAPLPPFDITAPITEWRSERVEGLTPLDRSLVWLGNQYVEYRRGERARLAPSLNAHIHRLLDLIPYRAEVELP